MKYCVKCGEELIDSDICTKCGHANDPEKNKDKTYIALSFVLNSIAMVSSIIVFPIALAVLSLIFANLCKNKYKYFSIVAKYLSIIILVANSIYTIIVIVFSFL